MYIKAGALLALLVSQFSAQDNNYKSLSSYHTLEPPFLDRDLKLKHYEYFGDTMVRSDKFIRLTPDLPDRRGLVASKMPALPDNFQIEIEFKIHGEGRSLHGDGMGIFLTKEPGREGSVMGMFEDFYGVAVLVDTYKNAKQSLAFPYIMAMKGDGGQHPYDAANDGKKNEIAGCSARGLVNNNHDSRMRITFVRNGFFSVDLDYKGHNQWTKCFETSEITEMPIPNYLTFSAQTGELSEAHDIYKVHVSQLTTVPQSYEQLQELDKGKKLTQIPHTRKGKTGSGSSGWGWFLFKLVLFVGVAFALYFGLAIFRSSRKSKRSELLL